MYVATKANHKRLCQTTVGWKLLVKLRDGYDQWVPLEILKETIPIEVSEFDTSRDIADEPAFSGGFHIPSGKEVASLLMSLIVQEILHTNMAPKSLET